MALRNRADLSLPNTLVVPAYTIGAAVSVPIVLYLWATRQQPLALATVLSALNPARLPTHPVPSPRLDYHRDCHSLG